MSLDALNLTLFDTLNASGAGPGTIAALEALAEGPIWLLPILIAGTWLFGWRAARRTAVMAGLAGGLSMAMAHVSSGMVDHPRPFMLGLAPNLLDHAADSSFPSDHTTLFFAVAVLFARRPLPAWPGLASVIAVLGLGVGLARVALGVHFPLDIVGAIAIGTGAALMTDLGLRRPGVLLFAIGERLRGFLAPLASRDAREPIEQADARPSR